MYLKKLFLWSLEKNTVLLDNIKAKPFSLMGIVNVTPDSFSDGGLFSSSDKALEHALMLDKQGADILDIGGESTRPNADPVSIQEELDRVIPVIELLSKKTEKIISIDTRHTIVMDEAIKAGASLVNDVNALQDDGAVELLAKSNIPVCLMHMQKNPKDMQVKPEYDDVVSDVFTFLESRIRICMDAGIDKANIVADVGIGFGKSLDHNLALLKNIDKFHDLGVPILLGTSRKSFIGKITGEGEALKRLGGSIASDLYGLQKGVRMFRVHDVEQSRQALEVFYAIDGHH